MISQFKRDEIAYELRHEDERNSQRRGSSQPRRSFANKIRQYLKVPYEEKEQAKSMGAKWDAGKKSWYVLVFQGQRWEPAGYEHWWK